MKADPWVIRWAEKRSASHRVGAIGPVWRLSGQLSCQMRPSTHPPYVLLLACCLVLAGCEKAMHDMYDQPRHKPYAASLLFPGGTSAQAPPEGTVPYADGPLAGTSSGASGAAAVESALAAEDARTIPSPLPRGLLQRGQERYEIYCQPCHGPVGDGDGLVVRRGFPAPPSFHSDHLRKAPDRHFFDVITRGYGVMHPYADRVAPADRWAIVAYIRALQLSQKANVAELPEEARRGLAEAPEVGR